MSVDVPKTLAAALVAFQQDMPSVVKEAIGQVQNRKYKYADLPSVIAAVYPQMTRVGLCFTARTVYKSGREMLVCELIHAPSDERQRSVVLLPERMTSQERGSAITYGRRYELCSMLGVAADEDDDGAAASATKPAQVDTGRLVELRLQAAGARSLDELRLVRLEAQKLGLLGEQTRGVSFDAYLYQLRAALAQAGDAPGDDPVLVDVPAPEAEPNGHTR